MAILMCNVLAWVTFGQLVQICRKLDGTIDIPWAFVLIPVYILCLLLLCGGCAMQCMVIVGNRANEGLEGE